MDNRYYQQPQYTPTYQPPDYGQFGNPTNQVYNNPMTMAASAAGDRNTPELKTAHIFAIISMICGIAGLVLALYYGLGAFIGGGPGLVFAIISGKLGNASGMRKTGLILSIISLALSAFVFALTYLISSAFSF
ncbi:MAG: DUF4190 domain-containing protein [Ruminococcaceae bacterium]|nr:DUF4190 domain-containing protein [Oscillospiraceae bacterium]